MVLPDKVRPSREFEKIFGISFSHISDGFIDNAVLSGPFLSVKDLQKSVQVEEDGIIGPITLEAIEKKGHVVVNRHLAINRSLRLAKFVQKNPNQLVFLVGWLNRCLSFIN